MSEEMVNETVETTETQEVEGQEPKQEGEQVQLAQGSDIEQTREEVKSQLKKLKINVDGEEIEEEIDLANEAELVKMLQFAKMSQKRAREAAELKKNEMRTKKDIQDFFGLLQKDPRGVLNKLGINEKELAEAIMNEELERSQMDPKELENLELKKQLQAIMQEKEQAKLRAAEVERERMKEKYAGEYERDLLDAIKENGLPENPEIIYRAANYLKMANDNGIDMSFKEIMPLVKEQIQDSIKALLPQLDLDTIERLISEDRVSELYKRRRAKETPKAPKKPAIPPSVSNIVDTATSEKKDVDKPKYKSIDPSKFWKDI